MPNPAVSPVRPILALSLIVGLVLHATGAPAQTRWVIDTASSLAWWQMSPNLNHLWATTCPADPSWRPGEGRSSGWTMTMPSRSTTGFSEEEDTVHVPLYPRRKVRHLCGEAVRGEVVVDTARWGRGRGTIAVRSDALVGGEAMRDVLMHQVLESARYPDIVFTLDSLVNLTRQGDTVVGSAMGTLTLRDQHRPITAAIKVFPDSGNERVLAKWHVPAAALRELTPSLEHLSLGLNVHIWKEFFMGADLVFRPAGPAVPSGPSQTKPSGP